MPRCFTDLAETGKELDRHYIGSRYPNFYAEGTPSEYYTKETPQEFDHMRQAGNAFITEVMEKGKVLYCRPSQEGKTGA